MKQKIVTYKYCLDEEEFVHVIDKNIEGQLRDGWRAVSIAQSVYQTKKKNKDGNLFDFNELLISVLYEKE